MPPLVYILSHIIGRLLVLLVEIGIVILSGMLLFDFEIKGNLLSFIVYATIGMATFTALATLLSSRGRSVSACYSIINLITLPLALFSGVWLDTAWLPRWLANICSWLPLTPLAEGLRGIAVSGNEYHCTDATTTADVCLCSGGITLRQSNCSSGIDMSC